MLIIPVITRVVGIAEFGLIMYASRFSQLAGTVINYGTNQSGVRDIAFNRDDAEKLSAVFYNTLWIRLLIFALFLIFLFGLQWLTIPYYSYILLSVPIVLAEVFNPLCFFIGIERLKIFNLYNMLSNMVCILALIFFINSPVNAGWVNFILGMANTVTYLGLLVYFSCRQKLLFHLPLTSELFKIGKDNFYLTINNISVNLQQSFIIFALPTLGSKALLGAYTLCDKIIGQCRILLITISNALYPNAAHIYKQSIERWNSYRRKAKYLIAGIFFSGSLLIFILADLIVFILTKEHDQTAVLILRIMAFVPTVSALNVLNVLDQLLKNNTVYIFRIALFLFITAMLMSFVLLNSGNIQLIGAFTLIVELCALLMYEYVIKKPSIHHA